MDDSDSGAIVGRAAALREQGARTLSGIVADTGGVLRAKTVPADRIEAFARSGMGASPTWPVFCVDNAIAMTEELGVVGDLRLRADLDTAVVLDDGFAVCAVDVRDQDGELSPLCWRDVLRRAATDLDALDLQVRVGHELEFVLTDAEGTQLGTEFGWVGYGFGGFSEQSGFATDVIEQLTAAGIVPEQIHAEYGVGQFELSLPPAPPLRSADEVLLARAVIGRAARRHGLRASFSPVPFAGGAGSGAHLHMSLAGHDGPLFSGGDGPHGITEGGAQAITGILAGLPASTAILAGTVVSGDRLAPGLWSGAAVCWGLENREAAVRLIASGVGNPYGANLEVKCIDAGANPYLATGLVLALAASGIQRRLPGSAPVDVDPAHLGEQDPDRPGPALLPTGSLERIELFAGDEQIRDILGRDLHAAALAVRRREAQIDPGVDLHALSRFAWSG